MTIINQIPAFNIYLFYEVFHFQLCRVVAERLFGKVMGYDIHLFV